MCFKKKILPSTMITESEFPTFEVPNIDQEIEKYLTGLKTALDPEKLIGDGASDYLSKVRDPLYINDFQKLYSR